MFWKSLMVQALFTQSSWAASLPITSQADSQKLANPNYGPIPGKSSYYSTYRGKKPPFPTDVKSPIFPTEKGPPAVDDLVWQNLLSAEWAIYSFYQAGVEAFSSDDFVKAGFPNTTYDRIQEIRDNEAGHLRIFQDQISKTSIKPGACRYEYPFNDPISFLVLQTLIEVSSMTFLTGLVQMAKLSSAHGAMLAIAQVETRHETWGLVDIWKANPFAGPADTVFPYANQILDITKEFVVPGSCPKENPHYPSPDQNLPPFEIGNLDSDVPGSTVTLDFTDSSNQPKFSKDKQYYATFFHGVFNTSVSIDVAQWPKHPIKVEIPKNIEERGIIVVVISDAEGAPSLDTVIAGPSILLEQPKELQSVRA